ncbi:hypothetical protein ATANTOWER_011638 [Ataeniobius toweri]|uniref:Uncharacterized protein n=1 Tax=Ataeniobius toweri TaxID=208326 RepID=A0ABU7A751_9TELE|nr:hypothetical protein [Ataeniobius toweri]
MQTPMGTGQERHTRACLLAEAALIKVDFPQGLEKEARTASHAFLRVCPDSESYPAASQPLKEPNVSLSYGSAGSAKSPSPQLRRLAAS